MEHSVSPARAPDLYHCSGRCLKKELSTLLGRVPCFLPEHYRPDSSRFPAIFVSWMPLYFRVSPEQEQNLRVVRSVAEILYHIISKSHTLYRLHESTNEGRVSSSIGFSKTLISCGVAGLSKSESINIFAIFSIILVLDISQATSAISSVPL